MTLPVKRGPARDFKKAAFRLAWSCYITSASLCRIAEIQIAVAEIQIDVVEVQIGVAEIQVGVVEMLEGIHMVHEGAVSRDTGMSESRLNRILNGWIDPHDHELKNIAHALGMGRDQLPHRGS